MGDTAMGDRRPDVLSDPDGGALGQLIGGDRLDEHGRLRLRVVPVGRRGSLLRGVGAEDEAVRPPSQGAGGAGHDADRLLATGDRGSQRDDLTQVLLFKFRDSQATFEATSGKVSVNRNALVDLGPAIRSKVKTFMADYLSSIQDI